MTKVEEIEQEGRRLSEQELASFRAWFSEVDAASWDRKFETDATSGRLDALAVDTPNGVLWFWIGTHAEYHHSVV